MAGPRTIVINGDLGSGKSTVSRLLSARLGIERISVGDLYRAMAEERGMTALQMNRHAELDDSIDSYVDNLQRSIAASGRPLVVDSRLAWHFFKDAFKVHLITDPRAAAERVLQRPADEVEGYTSVAQAMVRLAERSESERIRYLTRYGVDKTRLRNYDVVCDSTSASPDEIVGRVLEVLADPAVKPALFLDPRRIFPTVGGDDAGTLAVAYARPDFFCVAGYRELQAAIDARRTLVPAVLLAEASMDFPLLRQPERSGDRP